MQINILRRESLRVTRSGDTFYNRPLPEMTAFWMELERAEVDPHRGAFSIKAVLDGREQYTFGRRCVRVRPGQILLVNADETYSSAIDQPSKSLSVFYRKADVVSATHMLRATARDLLDHPHKDMPPEVAQVALETDTLIQQQLNALAHLLSAGDNEAAAGMARAFLVAALRRSLALTPPATLEDIVRRSTRDELLTRVSRARDVIHDRQGTDCSLDELARIACLSKYHFLRVFSEAFGETPLALARRLRLEAARRALAQGAPVPSVARRAGFSNLSAFRRALRRAN